MAGWALTKSQDDDGPWTLMIGPDADLIIRGHYEDWEALGHAEATIRQAEGGARPILWSRHLDDGEYGYMTTGSDQ